MPAAPLRLGSSHRRWQFVGLLLTVLGLTSSGCGASADGRITAVSVPRLGRWTAVEHIGRVLDLSAPRRDGANLVEAAGRLQLLRPGVGARPFASGPGGYSSPGGEEPYIALSPGARVSAAGCGFGADTLYALQLVNRPGITAIDEQGQARRFASLPARGLESGIAFDTTGRFGHRLLVTATNRSNTTLYAIDCRGTATTLTTGAPKVEGGIAVAPSTFGRFAGDLIAPDEYSGRIYALGPDRRSRLVAESGLPHGADTGVESAGFVPGRFGAGWSALLADRLNPGNAHPGDNVVLRLSAGALAAAGVRPGDLLVAGEGGARTDAIACTSSCRVRYIADGPVVAHAEGHIAFTPAG